MWTDGSLLRVQRSRVSARPIERRGGRKRSDVTTFSDSARRNLRRKLAMIDVRHEPVFLTLTYPEPLAPTPEEFALHRRRFWDRMRRQWRGVQFVCYGRLGFHASGVPHIHAIVFGLPAEELRLWAGAVWPELSGTVAYPHHGRRVDAEPVKNLRGAMLYLATADRADVPAAIGRWGRRWWCWGDPAPFRSEFVTAELPERVVFRLFRYLCRYARLHRRAYPSLTVVCDPIQWSRLIAYEVWQHYSTAAPPERTDAPEAPEREVAGSRRIARPSN